MRKFFLGIIFIVLAILVFAVPSFANGKNTKIILPASQTVNHDYFAAANDVEIHGTVNGDVYAAGGSILVDGTINGDILAAGGNVIVSGKARNVRTAGGSITLSQAELSGNVSAAGGQIRIAESSNIAGSVAGSAGSFNLAAPVGKDVNIAGGEIGIDAPIKGNLNVATNELIVMPRSKIDGDLTYWSNNKLSLERGASVSGQIRQQIPPNYERQQKGFAAFLAGVGLTFLIVDFIASFIIGLIAISLMPFFTNIFVKTANSWPLQSLGVGFLTLIFVPILIFVLFLSIIGIPLALILLFIFLISLYFGKIFIAYAIGARLLQSYTSVRAKAWALLGGLLVYFVISWIPIIGWIFQLIAVLIGLGALIIADREYILFLRNKKML